MIGLAAALLTLTPGMQTDSLAMRIDSLVAAVPGAEVAVAFIDLGSSDTLFRNADAVYHAASTMKIPVMMEILRSSEAGRLQLDQEILLVNQFASIVDGSPYAIDDDTDTAIYSHIGERFTVRELMRRMIVYSSNLATNAVIALVGAEQVNAMAANLGARNTRVLRGVQDLRAFEAGMNNTLTARDLAVLLRSVEERTAVSPAAAVAMRDLLLAEEGNRRIRAGVPAGVPVASKTGEITGHYHDSAILYPPGRPAYVLVVLTRGISEDADGEGLIAAISRAVWNHVTGSD
ncbi:MAG TPA: serine hydrolase [Gemmatimonadaceae bacterium]|nr:serine hydrolase [Gemmatimonadaceae bacterium]